MNSLDVELEYHAIRAWVEGRMVFIELSDGRQIGFPAARFVRLLEASAEQLAGVALRAGLVDELLLYIAPVLLGERGRPLFDGLGIDTMAQRLHLQTIDTRRVGDDLRVLLRPKSAA